MFTGVSFEKAIDYYKQGKEVLVLDRASCGKNGRSGYDTFPFRELFEGIDFLVDLPAVENPDFKQAVQEMMAGGITLDPEAVVQAVHDTQEEPEEDEQDPAPETQEVSEASKKPQTKKKKECDYDVLKGYIEAGKTDKEIAKLENVSVSVVKHWVREYGLVGIRKKGRVQKAKEEQTGENADRHLCKTCQYRGTSFGSARNSCDYIDITGHRRGCSVEECTVYVRGKRIKAGGAKTNENEWED